MSEKRQFFRIQHDVIFNFRAISNDQLMHNRPEQHFEHTETLCLLSEFQQLDNSNAKLLESIKKDNPVIAEYLETVDRKLALLQQQVLADQSSVYDIDGGRVDISQGGFAFNSDRPMGIESWLAVKLIFLPVYTGVISYAQVTRNTKQEDGSYLIGARFHGLTDEQSRIIARQILLSQVTERQQSCQFRH